MCGIVGFKQFNENANPLKDRLKNALGCLQSRGPDFADYIIQDNVGLGHTRLSVLDTSEKGNQPMQDASGRYSLIFNGEIYNHQEIKKTLIGINFKSKTDTEVLLQLLIKEGEKCLSKLNGFFSFAFYDHHEDLLMIARDKMGIKPLHYFIDNDTLFFASEMKALLSFPIHRKINHEALYWYVRLSYLPAALSMIDGVKKLLPGHCLIIHKKEIKNFEYAPSSNEVSPPKSYPNACKSLVDTLEESVKKRLVADVPLGAFLSGGIDSSAIVALASRHTPHLNTFSIGYRDDDFYDETFYSALVAKKFKTNHHAFKLSHDDLFENIDHIINYIDEPFGDSSAIPTYILSKEVKKHVTVALSGDGADELFGGYNKHLALYRCMHPSLLNFVVKQSNPFLSQLPMSRDGKWKNRFRQLKKWSDILRLNSSERYWYLATHTQSANSLLKRPLASEKINDLKSTFLGNGNDFNDYLNADINMLLPGDMLTKVDLMSMANSLEVRVPFLDTSVVNFATSLPDHYKVNAHYRKRVLQDAFKNILPHELYNREKKGFEVPLLQYMKKELFDDLNHTLFNVDFLEQQNLFIVEEVMKLKNKLLSKQAADIQATLWTLYVFQKWYKRYIEV